MPLLMAISCFNQLTIAKDLSPFVQFSIRVLEWLFIDDMSGISTDLF